MLVWTEGLAMEMITDSTASPVARDLCRILLDLMVDDAVLTGSWFSGELALNIHGHGC